MQNKNNSNTHQKKKKIPKLGKALPHLETVFKIP